MSRARDISRLQLVMHVSCVSCDVRAVPYVCHVPMFPHVLSSGDESRFIRTATRLIADRYDAESDDILIFVATDDPRVVPIIASKMAPALVVRVNAQADGIEDVTDKSDKETDIKTVVHSGPSVTISIPKHSNTPDSREFIPIADAITGLERMFIEWFLLRHTQHVLLTAWSLFGSTATNTHRSTRIINSSVCGKEGATYSNSNNNNTQSQQQQQQQSQQSQSQHSHIDSIIILLSFKSLYYWVLKGYAPMCVISSISAYVLTCFMSSERVDACDIVLMSSAFHVSLACSRSLMSMRAVMIICMHKAHEAG